MSVSIPTHLRAARVHDMEKKGTKEHMREDTELDERHKQGATNTGAERITNHLKTENVDRRLTKTIRVHSWQRLPPRRHQVINLIENRACNVKLM